MQDGSDETAPSDAQSFSLVPTPWRKDRRGASSLGRTLPQSYFALIWRVSGGDQLWLSVISVLVAVLNTVPIEIQRRVIDRSLKAGDFRSITFFVSAYAVAVILQGLCKLLNNVYRGWVSEHGVRSLRSFINRREQGAEPAKDPTADKQGTEISMIIAESEPIGAFMGQSLSELVLQGGTLASVVGYLIVLQPAMSLVIAAVFVPQMIFVPLMQRAVTRRAEARIAMLRAASGSLVGDDDGERRRREQDERFSEVFRLNMGVYRIKFTMNFLMNLCHQLGIAGILGIGGLFVVNGKIEVGTIVAFISGLATIKDPWDDVTNWFQTLMVTRARYKLLVDVPSDAT